jgi:drug/metabolite transporter (DMT)-like permease
MTSARPDRLTLLAFTATILLGGNNAVAVRFSNLELPPMFGAGIRFAAASLLFFLLAGLLRVRLPRGRTLFGAFLFGVLGFGFNYALMSWSLLHIQAGLLQVLLALAPLLTFLLAMAHGQEKFRLQALVGAFLAVGGIWVVFLNQINASAPILPLLAVVLAAAMIAESAVVIKAYPESHPLTTNAVASGVGALILLSMSAIWSETPVLPGQTETWAALFYLVLFGTVATFALALFVLKRWTASATSYSFVLFPIVTILSGTWLIGETVTGPPTTPPPPPPAG